MTRTRRGGWTPTLLVIGGLAVVAVLLLVIPPALAPQGFSPSPRASVATPTPPPLPEPSLVVSSYRSVEWELASFPDPAFQLARSIVAGERIVALGASGRIAAGWTSDDGGRTWDASTISAVAATADEVPLVSNLAATRDRLLALGWWVDETTGSSSRAFAWTSTDQGATWREIAMPGDARPLQVISLAGGADRFIGLGYHIGSAERPGWWSSRDGRAWDPAEETGLPTEGILPSFTGGPDGLVAAGSDADRPPWHPAAWFSTDGDRWSPTLFGVEEVGYLGLATASRAGYLVAGLTGPDERTLSQQGIPSLWISPDGRRWARVVFGDLMGAQIGAAAMNEAGAVLVIERLTSDTGAPVRTTLRFLRTGTSEVVDEELPLIGIQALAVGDAFVIIGSCAGAASADCAGTTVGIGQPIR